MGDFEFFTFYFFVRGDFAPKQIWKTNSIQYNPIKNRHEKQLFAFINVTYCSLKVHFFKMCAFTVKNVHDTDTKLVKG